MKWYTYLICFILIVLGAFCSIELYKEIKAESYVNGSIDITNKFSQESFNYTSSSLVLYEDFYDLSDRYYFEKELLPVDDFNGKNKQYNIIFNDYTLLDYEISAGSVFANINIDFYDTENNLVCSSELQISIKFLSDKTILNLTTYGVENAEFLKEYFENNGIRLKVIEIK